MRPKNKMTANETAIDYLVDRQGVTRALVAQLERERERERDIAT